MSVSVITDPLFVSGEIKFSELRDTFTDKTTKITASELFRNTNNNESNPKIPDATENANIAGNDYSVQSHGTDLSLLGFRNCIKTYDIKQEGTDTNYIIADANWNSNITKNIKKSFIVEGTIGSTNPVEPALVLVAGHVRNFTIDVTSTGKVHGAGGAAGNVIVKHSNEAGTFGSGDNRRTDYWYGDGQDGGEALYLNTNAPDPDTKTINIKLAESSQLWAGGGGGGMGSWGGNGGTGATVPNINGGSGGMGGNPGNGGVGQGYSQTKTNGSTGSVGGAGGAGATKEYRLPESGSMTTYAFIAGTGGNGGTGGTGGSGGDWGSGGDVGSSTGSTVGERGTSTSTTAPVNPLLFTVPSNPFSGMTIKYTELNKNNLRNGDKGTPMSGALDPYEVDGVVVGYKTLKFKDSQQTTDNDFSLFVLTPTLGEGETAAPNPRFTTDGLGLVADGPGKIKVLGAWNDSSEHGRGVENIKIYSSSGTPVDFTRNGNDDEDIATFDYDPNIGGDVPTSIGSPISGGSGYDNGSTYNWATSGGSGNNLKVDITATGGVVQSVSINSVTPGWGYQVGDIITILGGNEDATFSINAVSGDGNLVSFSMFRAAGHDNFITFGGKYDTAPSNHIDPTGVIPTFGPGTNWDKTYVETLSYDFPSGVSGPIWGVDTARTAFAITGIQISENVFNYGLLGIQLDDDGGSSPDRDFNDLMIIPANQSQTNILYDGIVLAPDPPSQSTVRGVGGNTGRAIKKIGTTSYNLTGNINTDTILGLYDED